MGKAKPPDGMARAGYILEASDIEAIKILAAIQKTNPSALARRFIKDGLKRERSQIAKAKAAAAS